MTFPQLHDGNAPLVSRQFPVRIVDRAIEEEILVMDLRKVSDEEKVNLCRKYTIHILLFILI